MRNAMWIGAILLLSVLNACNDKITAIRESEIEPGNRNYVWKVDTLFHQTMNYISTIWGASPDDVWAMGAGGTPDYRLVHYDGREWRAYADAPILCTGNVLFGFSANDVWMGGGGGWIGQGAEIWHYDGTLWRRHYFYPSKYGAAVKDIWGSSPKDIYACGYFYYESGMHWGSFVLHYDGVRWKEVARTPYRPDRCSEFLSIRKEGKKVYIWDYRLSWESSANDTIAFLELDGNRLKEIYANSSGNIGGNSGWGGFRLIGKKLYFFIGYDVFLYRYGIFLKQFSINHPNYLCISGGRNEKDIFLIMTDGLAHYNGIDMQYLYRFPWNHAYGLMACPMLFEKEVFFCLWDMTQGLMQNMILHGKLEE